MSGNTSVSNDYVIITDLDGTLTNSDARLNAIFRKMIQEFGFESRIRIALAGMDADREPKDIMRDMNLDDETRRNMEKRLMELISRERFSIMPDAKDVLENLRSGGFELALVTHNYCEPAMKFLKENGISSLFRSDLVITHDNFPDRKPSKTVADEIAKRSGRNSQIIIGNGNSDIRFAINCGASIILFDGLKPNIAHTYDAVYRCGKWSDVPKLVKRVIERR